MAFGMQKNRLPFAFAKEVQATGFLYAPSDAVTLTTVSINGRYCDGIIKALLYTLFATIIAVV